MRRAGLVLLAVLLGGCTRALYRRAADRDTYGAIGERDGDPRWHVPNFGIDPPPASRNYDPYDPNFPPLPPDDPAAFRYMQCADGIRGYRGWHKYGDAPSIENPAWHDTLPLSDKGILDLTPQKAVGLGVLNSRVYQTQLENVYLAALALTLNRFDFRLHWFGTNATTFTHAGSGPDELNTLSPTSTLGFTRNFAAGGQLLIDFANTFVFQYAGPDSITANSNIAVNFMQPLLRFAGRYVRMEALTQAERTLLYDLRSFAHFRKSYSFNIATQTYLQLLSLQQQIRNQQANLASLDRNFRLHEALYASGDVSSVKVDQVFQSVQMGRLGLIQAQAALETQQDVYKILIGIPPGIAIHLDDAILAPFQLNDPALVTLQGEIDLFQAEYRELDQAPPLVKLEDGFRRLDSLQKRTDAFLGEVGDELQRWRGLLREATQQDENVRRQQALLRRLTEQHKEVEDDLKSLAQRVARDRAALSENTRPKGWSALQDRIAELSAAAGEVFIIQTQERVFLIQLRPVNYELNEAVRYAWDNRLDLMNQRAVVVDAWRQIWVTASALKAGLNVVFNGNVNTLLTGVNPVDFRSSASNYSVGLQFDAPLNRYAERNAFRAAQIAYEQARRSYIELHDQIERTIRLDLRQLNTARLNFDISRQSLITAARQVESAREELLQQGAKADPTSTQNILNALNDVLNNQNNLINNWVAYETGRYQLPLDLEALQIDEQGNYIEESPGPDARPSPAAGAVQQPISHVNGGSSPYAQLGTPSFN